MPGSRFSSHTEARSPKGAAVARARFALAAALFVVPLILWLAWRKPDGNSPHLKELRLGILAEQSRDYAAARLHYVRALETNPSFFQANLLLALLLDRRFGDNGAALEHYRLALAAWIEPEDAGIGEYPAKAAIVDAAGILDKIRQGEIEDPWDAATEMLEAAEASARFAFFLRLDAGLLPRGDDILAEWRAKGEVKTVYRDMVRTDDGGYAALVELGRDGVTVETVRFTCKSGNPWCLAAGDADSGANSES